MHKKLVNIVLAVLILAVSMTGCKSDTNSDIFSSDIIKSDTEKSTIESLDSISKSSDNSQVESKQQSADSISGVSSISKTSSKSTSTISSAISADLLNYSIKSNYKPRVNFGQKFEPKGNYIIHGAGQGEVYGGWSSFDNYRNLLPQNEPVLTMTYIGLFGNYKSFVDTLIEHLQSKEDKYIMPQNGLMFCRN